MGFLNRLFGKKESQSHKVQLKQDVKIENFSARKMAYSPDGKLLVVAGGKSSSGGGKISINVSGRICILDAQTLKEMKSLGEGVWPGEVSFLDNGESVVGIIGGKLCVWNAQTAKLTNTLEENIELGSLSHEGSSALIQKKDGSIWGIDLSSGKKTGPHAKNKGKLLSINPKQQFLLHVEGAALMLRDALKGTDDSLDTADGTEISATAISQDGAMLAVGYDSGGVALYDLKERRKILSNDFCKRRINVLTFTHDGQFLAYGGVDGGLYLLDVAKSEIEVTLGNNQTPILAIAISPDSRILLTSSLEGSMGIWNVPHKTPAATETGVSQSVVQSKPEPSVVEVQCVCVFPGRVREQLNADKLAAALETCARFAGNQIASKYHIDSDHREVGIFTNDATYGAGVSFLWRVPNEKREAITADTKQEWQELLEEIDRYGVNALLDAGKR